MAVVGQNINGYTIVRQLSVGSFCISYEVQKDGVRYFMKEYSHPTKGSLEYKPFVKNQNRMIPKLKALGKIVEKIVDSFETECQYYQIKEFVNGVNLKEWMVMHISPIIRWCFAIQMCEIISAIHKEGIIHQDLKPSQFMVVVDNANECGFSLILTDFDWSILDGNIVKKVGTLYYGSIDKDVNYKTDTFSLGVILSELLVNRKPHNIGMLNIFNNVDAAEAYWNDLVLSENFTAPIAIDSTNITNDTSDVIIRCLDPKAENRPDVEEIIEVLKLDKKRFKPTSASISMLTPHLNVGIRVSVVNLTPPLGVRMAYTKVFKRVLGSIKKRNTMRVNMPKVSPKYKSISFSIQSPSIGYRNIANLLNK